MQSTMLGCVEQGRELLCQLYPISRPPYASNSPPPTTICNSRMMPSSIPLPTYSPWPVVQFPCGDMSCHMCNTFALWAATSARTAASTRKSAGGLRQRVQQCSGPQSSGEAGTYPLAPKRAYMAAWCFRSCCMEQSPGPSRHPSCRSLRFSIVGASAAFLGCAGRTAAAQRSFCTAHSNAILAPPSTASGCGGWAMSCGCLVNGWHSKSSLGSLEAPGQLVHRH